MMDLFSCIHLLLLPHLSSTRSGWGSTYSGRRPLLFLHACGENTHTHTHTQTHTHTHTHAWAYAHTPLTDRSHIRANSETHTGAMGRGLQAQSQREMRLDRTSLKIG